MRAIADVHLASKGIDTRIGPISILDEDFEKGVTERIAVLADLTPQVYNTLERELKLVIDYVLIHELAHLLEANHTPRFWGIVSAQTASMERARQWLREHGQSLEEEM